MPKVMTRPDTVRPVNGPTTVIELSPTERDRLVSLLDSFLYDDTPSVADLGFARELDSLLDPG